MWLPYSAVSAEPLRLSPPLKVLAAVQMPLVLDRHRRRRLLAFEVSSCSPRHTLRPPWSDARLRARLRGRASLTLFLPSS